MIGAVVLGAGLSARMGTQKLLLPYNGKPLIRHVVECIQRGPISETVVVTGHDRAAVEAAVAGSGARVVHNPEYETGMLSSVRAGVRAFPEATAILIALGDQPLVPLAVLTALVGRIQSSPDRIVVPVNGGRRGHPMIFGARFRSDVLCKYDDAGLRGLLREYASSVDEVEFADDSILADVDTPEDYAAALVRLRGG